MKRLVIITVGKTHSGKTTFARGLEQQLYNSIVIDQDNHAEFINTYYRSLLPQKGPNTIKYAVTQTIVDYAVNQTDFHLILCNSNRSERARLNLLKNFKNKGFITILVHLDIPDHILQERVSSSHRSTAIFRTASTFEEVLNRQQAESHSDPIEEEADYLFVIKDTEEIQLVTSRITDIANSLD
ncbi:ATP-binding protein [Lederbergia wuyishanensis]|uniref:Adenylate kinase family enzyme n=1 Tax=Lederbergia wuyishanensis TaxID=1347903 RepID=A0ABU0D3N0_9BACI|nr:ATP-binding protein [Lederbergia wuyishanensis]MCJ8007826.1 ATP-binding protein [Lederbergia wuyishanensis]MDQ0343006.1 adenylate kinase family enzyme [Lederbergia wuyishanensis]